MAAFLFQLIVKDGVTYFEFPLSALFAEVKLLAGDEQKQGGEKYHLVENHQGEITLENIAAKQLEFAPVRNHTHELFLLELRVALSEKLRDKLQSTQIDFCVTEGLAEGHVFWLIEHLPQQKIEFSDAEKKWLERVIISCSDGTIKAQLREISPVLHERLYLLNALPPGEFAVHFKGTQVSLELLD